jgi:DNA modification methylase
MEQAKGVGSSGSVTTNALPKTTKQRSRLRRDDNLEINKLYPEDRPAHEWYRFVLSFPPHLVRDYLNRFSVDRSHQVLDPFCGTGTTLVECKKLGISSVGIEANPMACFASRVKVDWSPDPDDLLEHASRIAEAASAELESQGIVDDPFFRLSQKVTGRLRTLPPESQSLLLKNSISPLPLHKTLVLLDCIKRREDERFHRHELLALARALVLYIGNLRFGPEVGVGPAKPDAPVITSWLAVVQAMAKDLRDLRKLAKTPATVHHADARAIQQVVTPNSIDAVITSPPYPNEKDYTRTTRLESVLLGFVRNKEDLRALKRGLVRSNTRGVYKADDDDKWVAGHPEIKRISEEIEARRIELGKTSGFERLYARVTKLYFGGMARHLAELRTILRPGAHLAYVVGDQASYLRIMIRTGQLLADIAQSLGYELVSIDLFRTRLATATKEELREEVVVLRWPGNSTQGRSG